MRSRWRQFASIKFQFFILNIAIFGFGIVLLFLTGFIFTKLQNSRFTLNRLNQTALTAGRIKGLFSEKGDAIKSLLIDPTNKPEVDRKSAVDEKLSKALTEMEAFSQTEELSENLKKLKASSVGQFKNLEDDIMKDLLANKKDDANFKYMIEYFPFRRGLEKNAEDLSNLSQTVADEQSAVVFANLESVTRLVLLSQTVGIGLLLLFVVWLSRSLVKKFDGFSSRLTGAATNIRSGSSSQLQMSQSLFTDLEVANDSLRKTLSAAEQINAAVSKNVELASGSIMVSNKGRQTIDEGLSALKNVIDAIAKIECANAQMAGEVEHAFTGLTAIGEIIESIRQKTESINQIVMETRLLSFNASVEASRAGEHGKGFAVVAEEVGKLAELSGRTAREIDSLLQESSGKVVALIEDIKKRIQRSSEMASVSVDDSNLAAKKCEQNFSSILSHIDDLSHRIEEFHVSSNEQAKGVVEITSSVRNVDGKFQKSSDSAKANVNQSQQIQKQAAELDQVADGMQKLLYGNENSPSA